jgi:hypothetical protein
LLGVYCLEAGAETQGRADALQALSWLAERVHIMTGTPIAEIRETAYRLPAGGGLGADALDPLGRMLADYEGVPHDLSHVLPRLHGLDRDDTTPQLWRVLWRRWALVRELWCSWARMYAKNHPLLGGNGEAVGDTSPRPPAVLTPVQPETEPGAGEEVAEGAPPPAALEQMSLRGRITLFLAERAPVLQRLPTLQEVYDAFPAENLGSKATFYRRNKWYVTARKALQETLQHDLPLKGHRNASDDDGSGGVDAPWGAPNRRQDEGD